MKRILLVLTITNFIALLTTFTVGAISFTRGALLLPDSHVYQYHFALGLITVIGTVGLHCLVFIYFLGTGRWVKEVARAYSIPDEPLPKETRELKRKAFPPALFAMLIPIGTAAAGMGQQHARSQGWIPFLHLGLALITLAINAWAWRVETRCVEENVKVIDEMMKEVDRIRAEKGLPTNQEALEQQNQEVAGEQ